MDSTHGRKTDAHRPRDRQPRRRATAHGGLEPERLFLQRHALRDHRGDRMRLLLVLLLPMLGTQFKSLPPGPAKEKVEAACYACHSADLLVQQRLTAKQWTATVEKMMRWGAVVPEGDKQPIIEYLSKHFGTGNTGFRGTKVRPV